ncbi:MAG: chromosomal replication initiator protein DnaA, partial [Spirochaetes bacterium]|nr:chromosomal replication initiator protein DnaA [Spirochaetota bacterium]
NIALPRQVAMYLSRKLTNYSTTEIGNEFGGKDHSTVIHAISKIENQFDSDDSFRLKVDRITKEIEDDH